MIDTLIFDFGDIFINLRQELVRERFQSLGITAWTDAMQDANQRFEVGAISEEGFLDAFVKAADPGTTPDDVRDAWNAMLGDFPIYRLEFLKRLSEKYRIFLLSNTDAIHIRHFEQREGATFISDFYRCFEKRYFSFEVGLRKPDTAIFNYVLDQNGLSPDRTLFIDDRTDNTDAAALLGIRTWQLQVGQQDVVDLFKYTTL